ncbi:class IV adenylate cyclase [Nocardiopsis sp. FIRDI 009]|uniref:class IV adenylate cyclase n=1 Tax=Nocardiopsis sp. FIRDI 009 TaxID=714197 RepID=UPI000E284EB5|nr:class IV adenylate cyclase [Nocardiopsis sp. FIRDI 009]
MGLVEVERKRALTGPVDKVRRRLVELGYRECSAVTEVDTYYSRPDVDFMETVECLRVRSRDGFAEITYKPASSASTHSPDGVIAKRETNVVLSDTDQARQAEQLLEAVGMVFLAQVEKFRTSFRNPAYPGLTVALDVVTGVGVFLETEIISDDGQGATTLLDEVEDQIGVASCPVVSFPYRDLVLRSQQDAIRT